MLKEKSSLNGRNTMLARVVDEEEADGTPTVEEEADRVTIGGGEVTTVNVSSIRARTFGNGRPTCIDPKTRQPRVKPPQIRMRAEIPMIRNWSASYLHRKVIITPRNGTHEYPDRSSSMPWHCNIPSMQPRIKQT